jgi:hypothetical protein
MLRPATLALVVAVTAAACAHAPRREVAEPVAKQDCDDAERVLAEHPAQAPRGDGVRRVLTTPLSWVAIGAGYTADVLVLGLVGVTWSVLICAPVWVIEAAVGGSGEVGGGCISGVAEAFWDQGELLGIGEAATNATRSWRCQDLRRRWAETLAVAGCLADRSGPSDLARATQVLKPLQAPEVERCLPVKRLAERDLLLQRLEDLHRGSQPEAWDWDENTPAPGDPPLPPPQPEQPPEKPPEP